MHFAFVFKNRAKVDIYILIYLHNRFIFFFGLVLSWIEGGVGAWNSLVIREKAIWVGRRVLVVTIWS